MPAFFFILLLYVILELSLRDMNHIVMLGSNYVFTSDEIILFLAGVTAILEILRVSEPGEDNTNEAIAMAVAFVAFVVLYVISVVIALMGGSWFSIFNRMEFVLLLILSGLQVVLGFKVNSRTLKRTLDMSSSH